MSILVILSSASLSLSLVRPVRSTSFLYGNLRRRLKDEYRGLRRFCL